MLHSTVLSFSVPRNKQSCYWRSGANLNTAKFQRFILLASFYSSSTNHNEVTTKTKKNWMHLWATPVFSWSYEITQYSSSYTALQNASGILLQRLLHASEITFFTFLLWIILYEKMFRHSYLSHWDSQEWYFIEVNSFAIRKENILDPPFDS